MANEFRIYNSLTGLVMAIEKALNDGFDKVQCSITNSGEIAVHINAFTIGRFNTRYSSKGWVLAAGGLLSTMPGLDAAKLLTAIGHFE